jgi:hypothetical protein
MQFDCIPRRGQGSKPRNPSVAALIQGQARWNSRGSAQIRRRRNGRLLRMTPKSEYLEKTFLDEASRKGTCERMGNIPPLDLLESMLEIEIAKFIYMAPSFAGKILIRKELQSNFPGVEAATVVQTQGQSHLELSSWRNGKCGRENDRHIEAAAEKIAIADGMYRVSGVPPANFFPRPPRRWKHRAIAGPSLRDLRRFLFTVRRRGTNPVPRIKGKRTHRRAHAPDCSRSVCSVEPGEGKLKSHRPHSSACRAGQADLPTLTRRLNGVEVERYCCYHLCDWLQSPITVTITRRRRSVMVVALPVLEEGAEAL